MPICRIWNVWYAGFKSSNRVSEPLDVIIKRGFSMDNEHLRGLCKCERFSVDDVKSDRPKPRNASLCLRPYVVKLFDRRVFTQSNSCGFSLFKLCLKEKKKKVQQIKIFSFWYELLRCEKKKKIIWISYFVNGQAGSIFWYIGWSTLNSWYSG